MIHSIHGCDVGQQGLSSADVGCSLLSSDMLLPGLFYENNKVSIFHIPALMSKPKDKSSRQET